MLQDRYIATVLTLAEGRVTNFTLRHTRVRLQLRKPEFVLGYEPKSLEDHPASDVALRCLLSQTVDQFVGDHLLILSGDTVATTGNLPSNSFL